MSLSESVRIKPGLLLLAIVACVALRICSFSELDLFDPSEGRYATAAKEMYLSGDWVTPKIFVGDRLVPFLGKPPLQTWASATAISYFGVTAESARLPCLLSILLTCAVLGAVSARLFSASTAALAIAIGLSNVLMFFIAGTCLTDPLLVLGTTIAGGGIAVAFFGQRNKARRFWSYLVFLGLALGALAKGPVALVLVGAGTFLWLAWTRQWSAVKQLPWVGGISIFLGIVVPWYALAEIQHPGFLNYFLLHENFLRFLVSNYGDMYGSAHTRPYGAIWMMLLGGFFPWIFLLIGAGFRKVNRACLLPVGNVDKFIICQALAPMLFFTVSRQVSFYYVLPALPWFALYSARVIERLAIDGKQMLYRFLQILFWGSGIAIGGFIGFGVFKSEPLFPLIALCLISFALYRFSAGTQASSCLRLKALTASVAVVMCFTVGLFGISSTVNKEASSWEVIEYLEKVTNDQPTQAAFLGKTPHSAYFYALDEAGDQLEVSTLAPGEAPSKEIDYVVMKTKEMQRNPSEMPKEFSPIKTIGYWTIASRRVG